MQRVTREEILKMPAGPEVDALVAERVMGWLRRDGGLWTHERTRQWHVPARQIPRFSTSIKAAWEVVEKLKHLGPSVGFSANFNEWSASFHPGPEGPEDSEWAESAPLAICRAAILATLEEPSK